MADKKYCSGCGGSVDDTDVVSCASCGTNVCRDCQQSDSSCPLCSAQLPHIAGPAPAPAPAVEDGALPVEPTVIPAPAEPSLPESHAVERNPRRLAAVGVFTVSMILSGLIVVGVVLSPGWLFQLSEYLYG